MERLELNVTEQKRVINNSCALHDSHQFPSELMTMAVQHIH